MLSREVEMINQRYLFPKTVRECIEELERYSGEARIIAGGTDLVLAIQREEHQPFVLLDITRIAELEGIVEEGGEMRLGARVTHCDCASSPLIQKSCTCLAEACRTVGSSSIQNVGTLIGNVVNAQPAADGAIALVALGARVEIVSTRGVREEKVEDLYEGLGKSRIDSTRELVSHLRFPLTKAGEGTAFLRIAPPNAMGLPVLNGAVWVSLHQDRIVDIRVALGPLSDSPFRPRVAERLLKGSRWDDSEVMEKAGIAASEEAKPRDSVLRGSAAYRRQLTRMLMKGLLLTAIGRARGISGWPGE
jgi:CO/xanthine dehydrogenase FAD-binding subunit